MFKIASVYIPVASNLNNCPIGNAISSFLDRADKNEIK